MRNVTLTIDGTLYVSEHWKDFNTTGVVLTFNDAHDITVNGKGTYDGRGFMWWIRAIF